MACAAPVPCPLIGSLREWASTEPGEGRRCGAGGAVLGNEIGALDRCSKSGRYPGPAAPCPRMQKRGLEHRLRGSRLSGLQEAICALPESTSHPKLMSWPSSPPTPVVAVLAEDEPVVVDAIDLDRRIGRACTVNRQLDRERQLLVVPALLRRRCVQLLLDLPEPDRMPHLVQQPAVAARGNPGDLLHSTGSPDRREAPVRRCVSQVEVDVVGLCRAAPTG